jgi:hypothetical protein
MKEKSGGPHVRRFYLWSEIAIQSGVEIHRNATWRSLPEPPTVFLRTLNNNVSAFWHEHCMLKSANHLFIDGDCMLVTLVALLCNGQLCLEKVVTTSDQSSITMMDCQMHAQAGIAEWLQNGPYRSWKLQSYKCIAGKYVPKSQA